MPGSITLPQVVLDLEAEDRKRYEALQPPKTLVVRYGYMRQIAELPYDGGAKPGCGTKLVIRSSRGIELAEMVTTTCSNGGCGSSITRKQMLQYIEESGGKNYPFSTEGRVLRIATPEDLQEQQRLDSTKPPLIKLAKTLVQELGLAMKLVDVEMLLGGERILFHYTSENWIDFRELVRRLASEYQTRIEMHQVNARDEARIVADYEKCGQHCCCRQFLKVLKPVSMRSAKVQKATLDPTKISGRCGRLMCCLRYEDETYETLRKKLPHRQSRVMTDDGPGTVLDSQILTQLALVLLDDQPQPVAFPIENLKPLAKEDDPQRLARDAEKEKLRKEKQRQGPGSPDAPAGSAPAPGLPPRSPSATPTGGATRSPRPPRPASASPSPASGNAPRPARPAEPRRPRPGQPLQPSEIESAEGPPATPPPVGDEAAEAFDDMEAAGPEVSGAGPDDNQTPDPADPNGAIAGRRRRRRRRRRRGGSGGPGAPGGAGGPAGPGPSGGDGGGPAA